VDELADRRSQTAAQIVSLRKKLETAEKFASGKACVYATGSFGRGEASKNSDLDLFIVGLKNKSPGMEGSMLNRLDEICIKADLIEATRALGIPDFDGDGRYLMHYPVQEFTEKLGTPDDDITNTFTARLLLLLESCPLLETSVYKEVTGEVIAAYWRDYEDHKSNFMPAFVANDILRMWRTFCVNYEARTERKPDDKKIKGKIKNYKLKHSRLLTCYSALLYLLAIYKRDNTVTPTDAVGMIELTPTQRLEWLSSQPELDTARKSISGLLFKYDQFLQTTNVEEGELVRRFSNKETVAHYMNNASQFGDLMFEALNQIGDGNRFHRLLVV
jgi:predicted nucleotidyltransferase